MTTLEQEVGELKARVERLEAKIRQLTGGEPQVTLPTPETPLDREQCLLWLKSEGLVRDPTTEEHRLAAEWDTLPEDAKQAHIRFMHNFVLDPPLSKILIENRR